MTDPTPPQVIPQRYEPGVDVSTLEEWPGNPNSGDVGAISEALDALGFYGAILVQESSRRVIAGNHRLRTARMRGMPTLPVLWADVDDDTAMRILPNDNETAHQAVWDEPRLIAWLIPLAQSARGLAGSGFDGDKLDDLIDNMNRDDPGDSDGDQDEWPTLTFKVPPGIPDRFHDLTAGSADATDTARFLHLLNIAETAG